MSVEVLGGSLDFVATLDTSQLEGQLQEALNSSTDEVDKFNDSLLKTANQLTNAFNTVGVDNFLKKIVDAGRTIQQSLKDGFDLGNIDPSKLDKLQKDVAATTDEFKKLETVIDFIKENAAHLNLNPDELNQLNDAINTVEQSFSEFTSKVSQGVGPLVDDVNRLSTSFSEGLSSAFATGNIDDFVQKVKAASSTITETLIHALEGIGNIDPSAINGLRKEVGTVTDEFDKLQKVINFIQDNLANWNLNPEQLNRLNEVIQNISKNISEFANINNVNLNPEQINQLAASFQDADKFFSLFSSNISQGVPQIVAQLGELSTSFNQGLNKAFEQGNLDDFISKIKVAASTIGTSLISAISQIGNIDPQAIKNLQDQVESTTGDFNKLQEVINFIKNNLSSLNLNPEQLKALDTIIEDITGHITGLSRIDSLGLKPEELNGLGEAFKSADNLLSLFSGNISRSIPEIVAQIGGLNKSITQDLASAFKAGNIDDFIAKIKTSADTIRTSLVTAISGIGEIDPAAIQRLQQEVDNTTGEFNKLQTVLTFIKDNLSNLNLNPEQLQRVSSIIDELNKNIGAIGSGKIEEMAKSINLSTQQMEAFNAEIAKTGNLNKKAFGTTDQQAFIGNLQKAGDVIRDSLQKGLSGASKIDPSKLFQLQKQVAGTTDEFKKLQIITNFIQNNLDKLNLNPEEVKQFGEAVKVVGASFDQLGEKELAPLTRLREIRNELSQLSKDGVAKTDPRFQQLLGEATEIQKSMRDVQQALQLTSREVPGVVALQQGFRGLLGGVEAVAGAMGLFNDNEEEAQKITKNLVALMTIFNGVEELSAILSKNSALNLFLEQKFRSSNAVAAGEEAVALEASNVAKAEGVAITESAAVAQEELNVAMIANPVAVILAGIVALYAAYKILSETVFRASDATRRQRAEEEALNDARKNAAGSIAEEESSMQLLLATAKDESLTRDQRGRAIDELRAKYPQYLSNLSQENLLTQQTSDAIARQTDLIKKKAIAAAAEDIYKEKLKKVLEAQVELNKLQDVAAKENAKNIGFFQSFLTNESNKLGIINTKVAEQQKQLQEATSDAEGTFNSATKAQSEYEKQTNTTTDSIQLQIDKLKELSKEGANSNMFGGVIAGLEALQKGLNKVQQKPFDPKEFDQEAELIKSQYQLRVEQAQKGTAAELKARRDLINKEEQLFNDQLIKHDARIIDEDHKLTAQGIATLSAIQSSMSDLDQEIIDRSLKNASAAAQSIVLGLQAAGQQSTTKFFEAQRRAIIAAANEEISQAKDNAGEILRIRAQLNLDLHNLDIQEKQQQLENQKSILNARLTLAHEGSEEELKIRLALIDAAAKEEILQAGKNQDKINEINAQAAKEKADLNKKFTIEQNETEKNIVLAGIETKLAAITEGSEQELSLKKQVIQEKAELDILDAQKQIKNEILLQAKIKEIRAKSLADQRKLEDEFFKQLLEKQLSAVQAAADFQNSQLQVTIDSPTSSIRQKQQAAQQQAQINIDALKKQRAILITNINQGKGDAQDLQNQVDQLTAKIKLAEGEFANLTVNNALTKLKNVGAIVGALGQAFNKFAGQVRDTNPELAAMLDILSNVADEASNAISAITSFASGDIAGGITSSANALATIVQGFINAAESARKARQEILDFQTGIISGEQTYNELLRERARQQVLLNKLTLQGLEDQKKLLQDQKQANQQAFDDVLKQLQQLDFIADEKKKKKFSLLGALTGGLLGALSTQTTTVEQITQSLAGKSFDELEKLFNEGRLEGKAKDLFEQLQKIKQEGLDIDEILAENAEKMKEALTGTTSDAIVDSIVEGFAQGKRSAADFAGTFEDLMRNAMLQALKLRFLEGPLKSFFDEFAALSESDGQLSTGEISQLHDEFNQIIQNANDQFQQLQQVAGISLASGSSDTNSLKGAIKGITEQTAELLAGQFGGLRLTAIDQLSVARTSLTVQQHMDNNIALTLERMNTLLGKFDAYETGVKKLRVQM